MNLKEYRGERLFLFPIFLIIALTTSIVGAQERELERARALLELPAKEAIKQIEQLSEQEAIELSSQIRFILQSQVPNINHIYYLLRHVESLRADRLANQRLHNLLWVIALTLMLFSSFLIYTIYNQYQSLKKIKALYADRRDQKGEELPGKEIYRGE